MAKKQKASSDSSVSPRRVTVAGIEADMREVADMFAIANSRKQLALEVVGQQLKALKSLQISIEGLK